MHVVVEEEDPTVEEIIIACYTSKGEERKVGEVIEVGNYCSNVMVNGREPICLYDTGASGVAVKEYLVKPEMYTKKWVTCTLMEGRQDIPQLI